MAARRSTHDAHGRQPGLLLLPSDPAFIPPPDYDQRGPGFPRVVNGRIDIRSFGETPVRPRLQDQQLSPSG